MGEEEVVELVVVCRGRLGSFRNLSFPAWGGGGPDTPPWNPDNQPNPSPASTRPSMDGRMDGWMDGQTDGGLTEGGEGQ